MSQKSIEFSTNLITLLEDNNMNQRELARKLYISDAALTHYIKGRSLPSYDILLQIANVFNVSVEYLLNIEDKVSVKNYDKILEIPVFRDIKGTDSLDIDSPNVEYIIPAVADRYKDCNKVFGKIITTDEMNPRIMKDDIIIFDTFKAGVDTINDGDICLISKNNHLCVIREMAVLNDVYCFNLFNVTQPPRLFTSDDMRKENITIIAKAIKLIHEF